MADQDQQRVTVTAAEAAEFLGLSKTSTRIVRALLGDPSEPLTGPVSRGAGRGRHRLVYADTLPEQRAKRERKPRSRPTVASLSRDLAALRDDVNDLVGLGHAERSGADAAASAPANERFVLDDSGGIGPRGTPPDLIWSDLLAEIGELRARHQADQDTIRRLEYQRVKARAAGDALRDALREQGLAIGLRRQAEAHSDKAFELVRAAEKLRDDESEPPEPPTTR